jgi:hypothetical protein
LGRTRLEPNEPSASAPEQDSGALAISERELPTTPISRRAVSQAGNLARFGGRPCALA